MEEALDSLMAIGPGAELIRLNGDHGESRRDGSIVGRGAVWIAAATNPG